MEKKTRDENDVISSISEILIQNPTDQDDRIIR